MNINAHTRVIIIYVHETVTETGQRARARVCV